MHSKNKSKDVRHSKGVRIWSIILSVMMVVSMLTIGHIVSLEAKAENSGDDHTGTTATETIANNDLIYPGKVLYIDIRDVNSWWFDDGGQLKLRYWNDSGSREVVLAKGSDDTSHKVQNGVYYFIAEDDFVAHSFLIHRKVGTNDWVNQTDNIQDQPLDKNCFKVKDNNNGSGNKDCEWIYFDDSGFVESGTGASLTAKQGFGASEDGVDLFPVSAQFYDYYTDYEVAYGWRSQKDKNAYRAVSRTWMNSYPFNHLNKYISNKAASSNWEYPLYLGNFFTYTGYYYNTDAQSPRFDNDNPSRDGGLVNRFNQSSPIRKFSSQANNSMFLYNNGTTADKYEAGVRYSFVGLVNSKLNEDNQLTMGTGSVVSPYFSDDIVNDGYATKVTTKFPMRVETKQAAGKNGGTVDYKMYSFNSKNGRDNVYFSNYDSENFKLNYSTSAKTTDALRGFDNLDSQNGIGFFPFDNENGSTGTTYAYDFGFGVRWDMPFNLTSDGKIAGSDQHIEFNFSGDDDVWVFVDGQLALDLGGDHKWATGKIDFADKTSTVTTGVYTPNGDYHNPTSYRANNTENLTYTDGVAQLNTGIFADADFYKKPHTLTVFYMERGMSESNLSMDFTMSPLENELIVDKAIDYGDVNENLLAKTKEYADSDKFDYTVKVNNSTDWTNTYAGSTGGARPVYTKNESTTTNTLGTDGKVSGIKNGEKFTFNKQLNDDPNASVVDIKESVDSNNKFSYDSHMSVVDVSNNNNVDIDEDTDEVNFGFRTASQQLGAVTKFEVHNVNKLKTADVTLEKKYSGTASFTFAVSVKLPNTNETIDMGTVSVSTTNGTSGTKTITGIPVGSTVTLTEKNADNYTVKYKIGSGTLTDGKTASVTNISEDTTVSFTNTDITNTPAEYTPTVKKYISGAEIPAGDSTTFDFALTQINKDTGAAIGTPDTKQNSRSAVTFDKLTFSSEGEFWYKIEETNSGADFTIDNSSTYSNVYYLKCNVTFNQTTHAFSVAHKYYRSNKTTEVADNAVIFNNIPVVKNGYLKVIKRGSDGEETGFAGTEFSVYKVTGNNVKPADNAEAVTTLTLDAGGNYKVSGELDLGWYAVIETKAPRNYELSGEVKWVEVTAANTTSSPAEVTFVNTLSPDLPTTGGIGVVVFITIGVLLIGAAIVLLKPKKEAKK